MINILNNGVYFYQFDFKEEVYFEKNKEGKLIKKEYQTPTLFQKSKFFMIYGYAINTETTYTSIFCFNTDNNNAIHKTYRGDAVTTAKHLKIGWWEHYNGNEKNIFEINYSREHIELNIDGNILSLKFSEDGRNLIVSTKNNILPGNKNIAKYTFLDWTDL
ncbi:MAG: hypothetical protein KA163_09270 [Bacteroidia bacterium]|nr:hypothetical protein [Bacteroidia bacterium]